MVWVANMNVLSLLWEDEIGSGVQIANIEIVNQSYFFILIRKLGLLYDIVLNTQFLYKS